ncbi:MAG: MarR family winged helix-turn-helix transcriptional regulator [Microthrixaceae bacterium]
MAEHDRPNAGSGSLDSAGFEPPCGVDDPRIHTFGLLLEAHARLTRALDADLQASDDISLQTFEVLLRIARSPGGRVTMSELADGVALTTGGVTRLADRLEKDGLVQRVSCPDDRRVTWLALTDRGQETLTVATQHHLDSLDRHVASRIASRDLPALHRALDTLRTPLV